MEQKIISKGAEAIILKKDKKVIKKRIPKGYRLKELDEKIRSSRTKKEKKLLIKASKIISAPSVSDYDEKFNIEMEYISGDKLSEKLDSYENNKQNDVMFLLGEQLAKLHNQDIIHGDLTTSNTILKQNKLYIIDFGLGYISKRIEDRAVDIHLIKQALEAKHWRNHSRLFENLMKGYCKEVKDCNKILEQLRKVESRGRYKH